METLKTIVKCGALLAVVALALGMYAKRHSEIMHAEQCAQTKLSNTQTVSQLQTTNLTFAGQTITGRITNLSVNDVSRSVYFSVKAKDCNSSGCVVIGEDRYFTDDNRIPAGEARDFVAHAGRGELLNIRPQGQLKLEIDLDSIDPGNCL